MLIRGWALIKFSPFSVSVVCLFCNETVNGKSFVFGDVSYLLVIHCFRFRGGRGKGVGWGWGGRLFEFDWEGEGVGAYSRLGAY